MTSLTNPSGLTHSGDRVSAGLPHLLADRRVDRHRAEPQVHAGRRWPPAVVPHRHVVAVPQTGSRAIFFATVVCPWPASRSMQVRTKKWVFASRAAQNSSKM